MKKFLGGMVFGFVSGVGAVFAWGVKSSLKREEGRKRFSKLLRDLSVKLDNTADMFAEPEAKDAEKKFELFDICGETALFSDVRGELEREVGRVAAEKRLNLYWLRDDGTGDRPFTIERYPVSVNYYGTVLTSEPIVFPEGQNEMDLRDDDWDWLDGEMSVREFLRREFPGD